MTRLAYHPIDMHGALTHLRLQLETSTLCFNTLRSIIETAAKKPMQEPIAHPMAIDRYLQDALGHLETVMQASAMCEFRTTKTHCGAWARDICELIECGVGIGSFDPGFIYHIAEPGNGLANAIMVLTGFLHSHRITIETFKSKVEQKILAIGTVGNDVKSVYPDDLKAWKAAMDLAYQIHPMMRQRDYPDDQHRMLTCRLILNGIMLGQLDITFFQTINETIIKERARG